MSVSGKLVKDLGAKADADRDEIRVDGRPLSAVPDHVYIVLNKPLGYVTTVSDPHAKHTVMDLVKGCIDSAGRIYPVGRLDADSAGLLILTNDGAFTQKLTHPSHQIPRTYRVVARGLVPEWAGADLAKGVILDDGMTAPAAVEWVDYDEANNASIIDVTLHEGRNRQIRRMFDAIGFPLLALTRMRIGPIVLKGLAPGTWRKLHPSEIKTLLECADSAPRALPQSPVDEPVEFENRPNTGEPGNENRQRSTTRPNRPDQWEPTKPGRMAPIAERSAAAPREPIARQQPFRPARAPAPLAPRAPSARLPSPVTPAKPRYDGREVAAREAARRLTSQLNASPDEEETEVPPERKKHGSPVKSNRMGKRP